MVLFSMIEAWRLCTICIAAIFIAFIASHAGQLCMHVDASISRRIPWKAVRPAYQIPIYIALAQFHSKLWAIGHPYSVEMTVAPLAAYATFREMQKGSSAASLTKLSIPTIGEETHIPVPPSSYGPFDLQHHGDISLGEAVLMGRSLEVTSSLFIDEYWRPQLRGVLESLETLHQLGYCHNNIRDTILLRTPSRPLLKDPDRMLKPSDTLYQSKYWILEGQLTNCVHNDILRAIKVYVRFLRLYTHDKATFDEEFYRSAAPWSTLYWGYSSRPVSAGEFLKSDYFLDVCPISTTDLVPYELSKNSTHEQIGLYRDGVDAELQLESAVSFWDLFKAFRADILPREKAIRESWNSLF